MKSFVARFEVPDLDAITRFEGKILVPVGKEGEIGPVANRVDQVCGGTVRRAISSSIYSKIEPYDLVDLSILPGLHAEATVLQKLPDSPTRSNMRRAGAKAAKHMKGGPVLLLGEDGSLIEHFLQGLALRSYSFLKYQKRGHDSGKHGIECTAMVDDPDELAMSFAQLERVNVGVDLARDLVNEPGNVLTTGEFADRLVTLEKLGIDVSVLNEEELGSIGMRTLLGVGQGSANSSKVVVMQLKNSDDAPFALVGKGVTFDTGGISLKPAKSMELMTMDMAGAAVVAGTMKSLALNQAKVNAVGIVGLVENMPSSTAQRPGDVVKSLKGDSIEVINTDAEGRLVLADLLWHVQKEFEPSAIVDLATLTGAIIVSLGHEYAGVFSNNDEFCQSFLGAASKEDEKAWRQPLDKAYDRMLESRIADMKNVGERSAGAITAAQFLNRFVSPKVPWIHLDIAGVASTPRESEFSPKGATGWGVRTLYRLILEHFNQHE